ncbi:hypothetical protein GA0061103_0151 [Rhizobium multihospitium]|uniref:Amidohydrolase-related domain-containing protein n=2 Tax=Rhizobium multihospitium TaxID=410764 RepID=A0A1C3X586_9HYPH|nr:hypothetical protein GA0061103_0151 [Rhizobium multihospitium]
MLPEMTQRIPASIAVDAGWVPSGGHWGPGPLNEALGDIQDGRIDAMNQAGVTLQVLSVIGPGAELLAGEEGISFARDYNDRLAAAVERHPDHFAAFAHLPMKEPAAAADELERCVEKLGFRGASINGTTDGLFLDDPRFAPILSQAEALACPLYIHPGPPPRAVRDVYYGGLPSEISSYLLSNAGFGWHSEVAIQILRLVLSGALDRNPGLKLIIGHMGELLPMLLKRVDETFGTVAETGRQRTVSETILDQVWITTSGFFDTSAFLAALTAFGTDRILFSIDYPYATNGAGVAFLNNLPVSKADRARIAHGNADSLLGL